MNYICFIKRSLKMKLARVMVFLSVFYGVSTFASQPYAALNAKQQDFIIVIDAGHGGKDHGTSGKVYREKDLALQMSLTLGKLIQEQYPFVKIHYTRKSDQFIPLYKRIDIANKINADLFISLHCNYGPSKSTYGTETYVMGMHRAAENLELAKRENDVVLMETNYEANYDGYDPNSPVGHILLSSFQNSHLNSSLELAASIEDQFIKIANRKSRGVKQAGFAVLRRATMPSILIETGFLSNMEEEQQIGSHEGQYKICQAIAKGLNPYILQITQYASNNPVPADNRSIVEPIKTLDEHNGKSQKKLTTSYRIQVAALKNKMEPSLQKQIAQIGATLHEVESNGMYKYQLGDYADINLAHRDRAALKDVGYHTTFIIENKKSN